MTVYKIKGSQLNNLDVAFSVYNEILSLDMSCSDKFCVSINSNHLNVISKCLDQIDNKDISIFCWSELDFNEFINIPEIENLKSCIIVNEKLELSISEHYSTSSHYDENDKPQLCDLIVLKKEIKNNITPPSIDQIFFNKFKESIDLSLNSSTQISFQTSIGHFNECYKYSYICKKIPYNKIPDLLRYLIIAFNFTCGHCSFEFEGDLKFTENFLNKENYHFSDFPLSKGIYNLNKCRTILSLEPRYWLRPIANCTLSETNIIFRRFQELNNKIPLFVIHKNNLIFNRDGNKCVENYCELNFENNKGSIEISFEPNLLSKVNIKELLKFLKELVSRQNLKMVKTR